MWLDFRGNLVRCCYRQVYEFVNVIRDRVLRGIPLEMASYE